MMSISPAAKRGALAAIVTIAIWTSFTVIARAMAHKTLTPLDIVFVRILGAALVLLPWGIWWVRQMRLRGDQSPTWLGISPLSFSLTAQLGLLGAVLYPAIAYTGFYFAPAAHASVLMPGFLPLWTALVAWQVLGTAVSSQRRIGLALILCGGFLVGGASFFKAFDGGQVWIGDLLYLLGSFVWACYTVMLRKSAVAAIPATIAITMFALLTFVPIYAAGIFFAWIPSKIALAPWSEILFQAISQGIFSVVISGITFVRMVEYYGPVRSTMITAVVPGLSAIGAALFIHEPLYWNVILGLCAVTAGIVFGVNSTAQPRAAAK